MASKPKVMVDLIVILDVLKKRDPFYVTSAAIWAAAETIRIQGYIAAYGVPACLFYLTQTEKSSSKARATVTNFLQSLKIGPVDQTTLATLYLESRNQNLDYICRNGGSLVRK